MHIKVRFRRQKIHFRGPWTSEPLLPADMDKDDRTQQIGYLCSKRGNIFLSGACKACGCKEHFLPDVTKPSITDTRLTFLKGLKRHTWPTLFSAHAAQYGDYSVSDT